MRTWKPWKKEVCRCWHCGAVEFPPKVIIDFHHISYISGRGVFLCRKCHDRLHNSGLHKGRIAFASAVRNPYFLYVLDGFINIETARQLLVVDRGD